MPKTQADAERIMEKLRTMTAEEQAAELLRIMLIEGEKYQADLEPALSPLFRGARTHLGAMGVGYALVTIIAKELCYRTERGVNLPEGIPLPPGITPPTPMSTLKTFAKLIDSAMAKGFAEYIAEKGLN